MSHYIKFEVSGTDPNLVVDTDIIDKQAITVGKYSSDTLEDCQAQTDRDIRLAVNKAEVSVDDIPVDDTTGYTTSEVLVSYGILRLTYHLLRANMMAIKVDDSYKRKMEIYKKDSAEAYNDITYKTITGNDTPSKGAFIRSVPRW